MLAEPSLSDRKLSNILKALHIENIRGVSSAER